MNENKQKYNIFMYIDLFFIFLVYRIINLKH